MKKMTYTIAALVFVATLVANTPAAILPWIVNTAGVRLALLQVDGSLWQGSMSAAQITYGKRDWFVDTLAWRLQPLSLFSGGVCLDILDGRAQGVSLRGEICLDSRGAASGEDLVVTSRVGNALALAKFPLPVDGGATLSIQRFDWSPDSGIQALQGTVNISDYAYQVAGQREVLGDYRMNISAPNAQQVALTFVPTQAKIALQGDVSVDLAGTYEAALQFIPSANASAALVDSLRFVAVPQDDGSYRFKYSGRF